MRSTWVFAILAIAVVVAQETTTLPSTTPPVPTTTTVAPPTTTTEPPKPTTTTVKPEPTTPKPAPTTTTPKPAPTTTTAKPPTPKEPTQQKYVLKNKDDVCLVAQLKVSAVQNATRVPFVNGTVNEANSSCAENEITLSLDFLYGNHLQMVVSRVNGSYYVSKVHVTTEEFDEHNDDLKYFEQKDESNQYYKCSTETDVNLNRTDVHVYFYDTSYQAFQKTKTEDFVGHPNDYCASSHSDVVIIAIGCALALLVVIILVAYLIARRRNRQRGYQSV